MTAPIIDDLKHAPYHFDTVADRIWRAWWAADSDPIGPLEAALREVVAAEGFPFTLVATVDGAFAGTVTSIPDDIEERPELGPCIAALWVEPEARGRGVAQALINGALVRLAERGFSKAYLASKPHLHDYYATRGWTLVERGVGDDNLDIFVRALP